MADSQTHLVFVALADPTRRFLFQQLCEEGYGTAAKFAARLPMTRQAITRHLLTLAEAGLVTFYDEGRERLYVPHLESLQSVANWIALVESHWDKRFTALRSYLLDETAQNSFEQQTPGDITSIEKRIQLE
jgi:DNA-binding transcriptional ArsR family regulator